MPGRRRKENTPAVSRPIFLPLAGLVVLLDQLTKALAERFLIPGVSQPVFSRFFHLTLIENQGIAFGLFQGADKILLIVITLSVGVLVVLGLRSNESRRRTQWGIGLILGGALGNWIDRIRLSAVIDFIDFRVWPVFNFADTAISVGVGLFLLEFFKRRGS